MIVPAIRTLAVATTGRAPLLAAGQLPAATTAVLLCVIAGAASKENCEALQASVQKQDSSEKRKLLNFVCSNSIWKDHTLTATFRQPFDLLAITNTTWQREKAAGATSSDLRPIWLRR